VTNTTINLNTEARNGLIKGMCDFLMLRRHTKRAWMVEFQETTALPHHPETISSRRISITCVMSVRRKYSVWVVTWPHPE